MTTTNHTSPIGDELLPCPFCGSAAEMKHSYQWWIQCTNEACGAVQNEAQMDPKGAADAWNRRADAGAQPIGDAEQTDVVVTEVGFITHDELHGWGFAPTVAWTWLGKGRALYARAMQASGV